MRKDKAKNVQKVATALAKDPLMDDREIEATTGVSKSASNRARKDLVRDGTIDKTTQIIRIAEADLKIVEGFQRIAKKKMKDFEEGSKELKTGDVTALAIVAEKSQKRHGVLIGENTDDEGGEIKNYIIEDA